MTNKFPYTLLNIKLTRHRLEALGKALHALNISYDIKDSRIYVKEDINFCAKGLTKLPDLSDVILLRGFYCQGNKLTTLEGAPQYIRGNFICRNNEITDLKGAPQYIGGSFDCQGNDLQNLINGPKMVGSEYNCNSNKNLTSLKGAPLSDVHSFFCLFCDKLEDLEYISSATYTYATPFGFFSQGRGIPEDIRCLPEKRRQYFIEKMAKGGRLKQDMPIKRLKLRRPPKPS